MTLPSESQEEEYVNICSYCSRQVKSFEDFQENHKECIEYWNSTHQRNAFNDLVEELEVVQ